MSVPLPTVFLAPPIIGANGIIDVSNLHISAAPVDPITGPFSRLELDNESGAGLLVTFSLQPGTHWRIYANSQRTLNIPPGETKATWQVDYVFGSSYVGMVLLTFYEQWEPDPPASLPAGGANPGNQARMLTLGVTPTPVIGRAVTLTAALDIILRTDTFLVPNPASPAATFYLYWARLRLSVPAAASVAGADVTLVADLMNGATVVSSTDMHYMDVTSSQQAAATGALTQQVDEFVTNNPAGFTIAATPPVTGMRYRLHVNAIFGAPLGYYSIAVSTDVRNGNSPGTHGNFTFESGGVIY